MPNDINDVRIEPLSRGHERAAFLNSVPRIQEYCRKSAFTHHKEGTCRTFVAVEGDCVDVIGFYYLCLRAYSTGTIDGTSAKQFERFDTVPAVYLGMIGTHSTHEGAGVGHRLMQDALLRAVLIADNAGTYAVTLDARDSNRASFYQRKFGFQRFRDNGLSMFLPIRTIRKSMS